MIKGKGIDEIRLFFRLSNATFEFAAKFRSAMGQIVVESEMEKLHKIALTEVEKENPDIEKLDELLQEMEVLAALNAAKSIQKKHSDIAKKYPKGGISANQIKKEI